MRTLCSQGPLRCFGLGRELVNSKPLLCLDLSSKNTRGLVLFPDLAARYTLFTWLSQLH